MMRSSTLITAFAILCFTAILPSAKAQEDPWTKYMTPSSVHAMLKQFDGDWNQEVSIWMDQKQPPQKFALSCSNKMILGGRYMESRHAGNMGGMPFEGLSYLSFNNTSNRFQHTSYNNIGTGTLALEGTWQDSAKSINFKGTMTNPENNQDIKVRQLLTFVSKNEYLIENFDQKGNEPEVKTMQYRFTRKK